MNELALDFELANVTTHLMKLSNQWIAGFFDGEGSVSITRRERGGFIEHSLCVQLGQNDRRPLDIIASQFTGSVCNSKTPSGCWRWRAHGGTAERFLKAIRQHAFVKREKIELALQLRKLVGKPGKRVAKIIWEKKEAIWREFYGRNTL